MLAVYDVDGGANAALLAQRLSVRERSYSEDMSQRFAASGASSNKYDRLEGRADYSVLIIQNTNSTSERRRPSFIVVAFCVGCVGSRLSPPT